VLSACQVAQEVCQVGLESSHESPWLPQTAKNTIFDILRFVAADLRLPQLTHHQGFAGLWEGVLDMISAGVGPSGSRGGLPNNRL
jgi:hypothetical protein